MSHLNSQEPSYCWPQQHWQTLPDVTFGQINWTRPWFLESSTCITNQSKSICLLTAQWHIWLQRHLNGTTWNASPSTWKTKCGGSWVLNGEEGWYVGPAKKHYRCYTIHVNQTNSECIGDTVAFFLTHTTMPAQSTADAAMQIAKDLIHALKHPQVATPFNICQNQQGHVWTPTSQNPCE
jgi:hypothetical protein